MDCNTLWFPPISSNPIALDFLEKTSSIHPKHFASSTSPSVVTGNKPTENGRQELNDEPIKTKTLFVDTDLDRSLRAVSNRKSELPSGPTKVPSKPPPRKNSFYPLPAAKCLGAPFQSVASAGIELFIYTYTLPNADILAKLAALDPRCFQHSCQTYGLLFTKAISQNDYVCRLPLYLTRGMARARVQLVRRLQLNEDQLKLINSAHYVLADLLTNIADLSHVGLSYTTPHLSSLANKKRQKSAENGASIPTGSQISIRDKFDELQFDPLGSKFLGLVTIMDSKTLEIDYEAIKTLIHWSKNRSTVDLDREKLSTEPVLPCHSILPTCAVQLSRIPSHEWSGLMVRPCHLPDNDPGMFAVSTPCQKTGLDLVPPVLVEKVTSMLTGAAGMDIEPMHSLSYLDYFSIRYPVIQKLSECVDPLKPLATCFRLTRHQNAAQVTAGMRREQQLLSDCESALYLSGACFVYPLSAWLWFQLSILPVLLYQLNRALSAGMFCDELCRQLANLNQSIAEPLSDFLALTGPQHTILLPDRVDAPRCMLSEFTHYTDIDSDVVQRTSSTDHLLDEVATSKTVSGCSPHPSDLLEATTLLGARDVVNLERLELLGDSLLQLVGTLAVFSQSKVDADEGVLTSRRVAIVSNSNLCRITQRLGWDRYCTGQVYSPSDHFIFPCYTLKEAHNKSLVDFRLVVKLTDKSLADMMEGLIGCYLHHLGFEAAVRFLVFLGVSPKMDHFEKPNGSWCELLNQSESSDTSRQSPSISPSPNSVMRPRSLYCGASIQRPIPTPPSCDSPGELLGQDHQWLLGLQNILNYQFQDISLLIQSLTHPSSSHTATLGSYQRLEFLGDAVLGYVVTLDLYGKHAEFDPGRLTESRSNIVSNNSLACSLVEHKIHSYICHNHPAIDSVIAFITFILDRTDSFSEQLELLTQEVLNGLRVKPLADVFEAIIGAIFVDSRGNLNVVSDLIHRLLDDRISDYLEQNPINPLKSMHLLHPDLKYSDALNSVAGENATQGKYKLCATLGSGGGKIYTYGATRNQARLALAQHLNVPLRSIDQNV